jgi:hypothetical protein
MIGHRRTIAATHENDDQHGFYLHFRPRRKPGLAARPNALIAGVQQGRPSRPFPEQPRAEGAP